jgi:DNA modification methylase
MAGNWKINADLVAKSQLGWFDPFMGHGTSPLYAKRHGKNYVGIEINPDSMNGFLLPYVQKAVTLYGDPNARVELRLGDSAMFYADLVNRFDLCYTSPPYFNFEDYGFHNKVIQDCIDYDEYHRRVTIPVFSNVLKYLIDGGVLALQTEKNKTLKDKWVQVITCLGFTLLDDTITGQEANKYSTFSKRDQSLLIFRAPRPR